LPNPLLRKLELFGPLNAGDKKFVDDALARARTVAAHTDLISEGQSPSDVHLVVEGLCCRYKILPSGQRQIFAYLVPGDFCDLNVFILRAMDHNIATLAVSRIVEIPRDTILAMVARPQLARALWWATLVDEATLREWLVNVGQRTAEIRIAHLFCEIHLRLSVVGQADDRSFFFPVTQVELADTVGLSPVHVNRSLQSLRARDLIDFKKGLVELHDLGKLRKLCSFNPNYLHLEGGKLDRGDFGEDRPRS
jgi:CRP-like cAMP-binding protein